VRAPLHRRTEEIGTCFADPSTNGEGGREIDLIKITRRAITRRAPPIFDRAFRIICLVIRVASGVCSAHFKGSVCALRQASNPKFNRYLDRVIPPAMRERNLLGITMKLPRRNFLHLAAGAAASSSLARGASALDYPTRPVHFVVGFAAGSAFDVLGRLISQRLSERLGQPCVIENRPGAGGNIATEAVVRARPDGYTVLVTGSSDAINATLYQNLNFNFIQDILPVAGIARSPNVMVVHPLFPAKTVPEFIAYAKANPGRINMATVGVGSATHMSGELFKLMAGVDLVPVPYRGQAAALTDLLAGHVQVDFASTTASIEFVRAGRLRALAVTSATPSEVLPGVPTIGEFLPGYEASVLTGLGAPRNTPAEIIERLNKETNTALADPMMQAQLADMGNTVLPGSPAAFAKLIADEIQKWAAVIRAANIKPE
jgi:tripartite-type tricarboxylate transporter receptor subunit TctC